ncbi:unnamed protein product [Parnassius apollo]|uniref:(apollo) hypothetical protein n=1 Tax=Parnassius apollo TaxID=110799 RepID=A0A8S3YBF6_PARAO|nr:unnamed protein product [Parnassius apollo]
MTSSLILSMRSELSSVRPAAEEHKNSPITHLISWLLREMKLQSSADLTAYRQLNRQISKYMRRNLRNFNTAPIEKAIERNQGSKVFARYLFSRKSQLSKLKTECGSIASRTPKILSEIERFYWQLYASSLEPHASLSNDPRASLFRYYSDDISDVNMNEIRMALQHLKNGKSPGVDGIINAGGKLVLEVLQKLFNFVVALLPRRGAETQWSCSLRKVT